MLCETKRGAEAFDLKNWMEELLTDKRKTVGRVSFREKIRSSVLCVCVCVCVYIYIYIYIEFEMSVRHPHRHKNIY